MDKIQVRLDTFLKCDKTKHLTPEKARDFQEKCYPGALLDSAIASIDQYIFKMI